MVGGSRKVVSDRFIQRVMACISSVAKPSASRTTASGFPISALDPNTSIIWNFRLIRGSLRRIAKSEYRYLDGIGRLEVSELLGVADGVDEIDLAVADAERDGAHHLSALGDEHSGVAIDFSNCKFGSEAGDRRH